MKYELRQMLRNDGGIILNCSSIGGVIGVAGLAAYRAAKTFAPIKSLVVPAEE